MYGLVNKAVKDLIVKEHGDSVWQRIKSDLGLEHDVFYAHESYDDDLTFRIVAAAAAVSGRSAHEILFAFGEHWVLETARHGYGSLLDSGGRSFPEFLCNLPAFHDRVAGVFPHLCPPEFQVSDLKEKSLHLHYVSKRPGLTSFVEGLLSGIARKFSIQARVTILARKDQGAAHDTFLVEWL